MKPSFRILILPSLEVDRSFVEFCNTFPMKANLFPYPTKALSQRESGRWR
jgi:hypothetical protein